MLIIASIGFVIVAGTVLFLSINQENIKAHLEDKFYAKTGYSLKILGNVTYTLLPHGIMKVHEAVVRLPNTAEDSTPFITIKRIKMGISLPDLMDGKIKIKKLTIEQPTIHIVLDKKNQHMEAIDQAYHTGRLANKLANNHYGIQTDQSQISMPIKKAKKHFSPDIHVKAFRVKDATIIVDNRRKNQKYVLEHVSMHNPTFELARHNKHQSSLAPWLHLLQTHGKLSISDILLGQLHINHVSMHYNFSQGKLTLSPVHYRFNNTPGIANFIIDDKGDHLHIALKNRLNNADLTYTPLKEAKGSKALAFATMPLLLDIESGKLSVNTYIYADIRDFSELDKHLNGSIRLALTNGSIKRFNLAYELRRLEDRINRIEDTPPPTKKTTPFEAFTVEMRIKDGEAKSIPVVLNAPDFSFNGFAHLNMAKDPAWLHMRVYIKPQPNKYKKLEDLLTKYLKDANQGSIPLEFDGPLYTPSKLAITVDDRIAEDILKNFFSSWPESLKKNIVAKLQTKLKKSLKKMQKRLNEG